MIWKACHNSCRCYAGNPLRPEGWIIYWASTLRLSQHLLAEDLLAHPYSLMIITDHLPKWLINKAEAKQIIYLYGTVDTKFRVNCLKRIRGPGHQVMDGRTRLPWKYDPFNKFAVYCSYSSFHLPLHFSLFMKLSLFPLALTSDKVQTSPCNITYLKRKYFKRYNCQMYEYKYLIRSIVQSVDCTSLCKTCESFRTLKWWDKLVRGQSKPCQDISLWHSLHKSHKDS